MPERSDSPEEMPGPAGTASPDEFPLRDLTDPRELRALAHPVRLHLLEELVYGGPATATELSARVGESPANCSWHLRQLAKYGYVEETGTGKGRHRPWRYVPQQLHFGETAGIGEASLAANAVADLMQDREYALLQSWRARQHDEPAEWREASFINQSLTWLTAEELRELGEVVVKLWLRHADRITDPSCRPRGARPVRLFAWGIPGRPHQQGTE